MAPPREPERVLPEVELVVVGAGRDVEVVPQHLQRPGPVVERLLPLPEDVPRPLLRGDGRPRPLPADQRDGDVAVAPGGEDDDVGVRVRETVLDRGAGCDPWGWGSMKHSLTVAPLHGL